MNRKTALTLTAAAFMYIMTAQASDTPAQASGTPASQIQVCERTQRADICWYFDDKEQAECVTIFNDNYQSPLTACKKIEPD